ncbi:hypothetical protein CN931_08715 [Bacillus sp. AFS054943]|uniref:Uncharacterized protein n=1 Tax=Bacillus cereus TaxID=1396 RepID=A0A2C1LNY0_BACCE|nr:MULTISPECIES: DUF3994 domain-containing protein [Bacillus]PGL85678.1 hypothetical protein CN931_08715 [Bacillus sp. AFS054943]PGT99454.1 hypothetical protein COD19_19230 [Bacillus cereus]
MKAKKLLGIAVPVMLLMNGCVTIEKSSKEEKTEESKPAKADSEVKTSKESDSSSTKRSTSDVKKVRVLAEDYPMYLIDLGNEFDRLFREYNDVVGDAVKGNKTRKDVLVSVENIFKAIDKFEEIDPPNKYIDAQKDIEKATAKYRKAFEGVERIFSQNSDKNTGGKTDKEVIENAEKLVKEGDKYWVSVYNQMKDEVTKANGGGVSSSEKAGVSDTSGVNLENVKNNVKDGTDLIANWGLETSNGFLVSLIIKGAGDSFELYTAGDYPNKNNVTEGTWSYDKNSMTFTLHITKQMEHGQEVPVSKKDIAYKVQNYDRKTLQLLNVETNNTTRYVKQS